MPTDRSPASQLNPSKVCVRFFWYAYHQVEEVLVTLSVGTDQSLLLPGRRVPGSVFGVLFPIAVLTAAEFQVILQHTKPG